MFTVCSIPQGAHRITCKSRYTESTGSNSMAIYLGSTRFAIISSSCRGCSCSAPCPAPQEARDHVHMVLRIRSIPISLGSSGSRSYFVLQGAQDQLYTQPFREHRIMFIFVFQGAQDQLNTQPFREHKIMFIFVLQGAQDQLDAHSLYGERNKIKLYYYKGSIGLSQQVSNSLCIELYRNRYPGLQHTIV